MYIIYVHIYIYGWWYGETRTSPAPSDLAPAPAPWQRTPLPRTRVPGSSRAREVQEAAALVQDGSLLMVVNDCLAASAI